MRSRDEFYLRLSYDKEITIFCDVQKMCKEFQTRVVVARA